ncbi:MAG: nucleotidyltransferase [Thermonema sp.]|nr:MAG: nucleotidyltransferase [Thermonema sp.]
MLRLIIPMAGMGKRMRPHTLTVPKPLIPIAGKPIVHRLVEDIAKTCPEPIGEVAFIIKESFGKEVEEALHKVAESIQAEAKIYYQHEALGTAHAILCAADSLQDKTIIAFADTLFKADFTIDTNQDGIIWVQEVEDPRPFGVVKLDDQGYITEFIEKPQTPVSNLAIIGIYYIKDGANLKKELQYLIDNDIKEKGEYQLTNALENMKQKGLRFTTGQVSEWLDCGNKDATVHTNQRYLEFIKDRPLIDGSAVIEQSVIVPPVYVGEGVVIRNAVVGPHVSIGAHSHIENAILKNGIIQTNSQINGLIAENFMIGNFVVYSAKPEDLSIGDYNQIKK